MHGNKAQTQDCCCSVVHNMLTVWMLTSFIYLFLTFLTQKACLCVLEEVNEYQLMLQSITYCQNNIMFTAWTAHAEFRQHVTSHAFHHIQGLDVSALLPKQVLISNKTIGVQVASWICIVSPVWALTWPCLGLNMQALSLPLPAKPDYSERTEKENKRVCACAST